MLSLSTLLKLGQKYTNIPRGKGYGMTDAKQRDKLVVVVVVCFYLTTRKTPNKNKEQKQWPKNRLQRQNDIR